LTFVGCVKTAEHSLSQSSNLAIAITWKNVDERNAFHEEWSRHQVREAPLCFT